MIQPYDGDPTPDTERAASGYEQRAAHQQAMHEAGTYAERAWHQNEMHRVGDDLADEDTGWTPVR